MLDAWRSGLAERPRKVLHLPELPPKAGQAMATLWQLAVDHAERLLQARMATERAALAANEARLTEERARWATTLAEAETAVAQARTRRELAEHACANLDSQLRDSHALREDLLHQRIVCRRWPIGKRASSKPCRRNVVPASPPRSRNGNA